VFFFCKKRTKKTLPHDAALVKWHTSTGKSFLLLFFKKEGACFALLRKLKRTEYSFFQKKNTLAIAH
jgi:hypothetical protein